MNQKEKFIDFLTDSTKTGGIAWESRRVYMGMSPLVSQYITNPDMVSQLFCSDVKGNNIYFVVQKYMKYVPEMDQYYEQFTCFLLVLDGDTLVYSVYESEVSEDMLNNLLEEIRGKQESDFYENFMKK